MGRCGRFAADDSKARQAASHWRLVCPVQAREDRQTIRIGFTPAFVHDQHALLADWRRYMERRLGLKVEIVQRRCTRGNRCIAPSSSSQPATAR